MPQRLEGTGDNPEHERSTEEADELDRLSADVLDGENRGPVARQESSTGDDEVSGGAGYEGQARRAR